MAKSLLLGGGVLFWPVSSFLPTFLTIFSILCSENVLKRFFGLPRVPQHADTPYPLYASCGVSEPNLSYWGSAQKGSNPSYWGVPYWGGGVYGSFKEEKCIFWTTRDPLLWKLIVNPNLPYTVVFRVFYPPYRSCILFDFEKKMSGTAFRPNGSESEVLSSRGHLYHS